MEKIFTAFMLYLLAFAVAIPTARGIDEGPEAVQEWFKNLPHAKQKLTKLHFYYHDTVTGKNPSAVVVAQANFTSPTFFGTIWMMDTPLTVGPEPDSKLIGRAQGIGGGASFNELGFFMTFNFVFTDGYYNGSTLSVLCYNPISHKYRELPIVGGSGVFRLAKGIATAQTVSLNLTSQSAPVEFHVVVLHYESE